MRVGDFIYNKNKTVAYRVTGSSIPKNRFDSYYDIWIKRWWTIDQSDSLSKQYFDAQIIWTNKHSKSTYKLGSYRTKIPFMGHMPMSHDDRISLRDNKINSILL